jgi:hypothetical protein
MTAGAATAAGEQRGAGQRADQVLTAERSHRPRQVKVTITTSLGRCESAPISAETPVIAPGVAFGTRLRLPGDLEFPRKLQGKTQPEPGVHR